MQDDNQAAERTYRKNEVSRRAGRTVMDIEARHPAGTLFIVESRSLTGCELGYITS